VRERGDGGQGRRRPRPRSPPSRTLASQSSLLLRSGAESSSLIYSEADLPKHTPYCGLARSGEIGETARLASRALSCGCCWCSSVHTKLCCSSKQGTMERAGLRGRGASTWLVGRDEERGPQCARAVRSSGHEPDSRRRAPFAPPSHTLALRQPARAPALATPLEPVLCRPSTLDRVAAVRARPRLLARPLFAQG